MAVTDAALHGRHGPYQRLVLGKQPPQRDARRHLCQQEGFLSIWLTQAQYLSEHQALGVAVVQKTVDLIIEKQPVA